MSDCTQARPSGHISVAEPPGASGPTHETPWIEDTPGDGRNWGPKYRAVINGWVARITDNRLMIACANRGHPDSDPLPDFAPFEVSLLGHVEIKLPTLDIAKGVAEALACDLPPGAAPGCWTEYPEAMRASGWRGSVRVEDGVYLEVIPMNPGKGENNQGTLDILVDHNHVATLIDYDMTGVEEAERPGPLDGQALRCSSQAQAAWPTARHADQDRVGGGGEKEGLNRIREVSKSRQQGRSRMAWVRVTAPGDQRVLQSLNDAGPLSESGG